MTILFYQILQERSTKDGQTRQKLLLAFNYFGKNEIIKNKWLKLCGDRLKILSNWRTDYSIKLLKYLDKYRTLTFCNSIEQTQILGKYCINSKNKSYQTILSLFNSGKINHITACSMLDEGANLSNCQIGIYAILNSSERLIKQKLGRLLVSIFTISSSRCFP